MAKITTSEKSQAFVYDFNTDGGGIGTINMGDFIPIGAVIWFGFIKVIVNFASGGAATIAIGFAGNTGALVNPIAYTSLVNGAIITGVNLPVAPVLMTAQRQLAITIAGAPVTAGELVYECRYTEWNI